MQRASQNRILLERLLEPSGIRIDGDRPFDMRVRNEAVYTEAFPRGLLGMAEAYVDGWWDTGRLDELSFRISSHPYRLPGADKLRVIAAAIGNRLLNRQTRERSRGIGRHYNLGNDLFAAMLDRRMIYSCAYWKDAGTLDQAQEAKLDLICRKIGARPGMRVLDIGCGWGGFAKFAAEHYGAAVTGITICEEQLALARELCAGLPITLLLQDYRDLTGSYDAVVSVGMFEHVGVKNYRRYMNVVRRVLKPEGIFLLHTIGGNRSVRAGNAWMNRYIFPNGMLPSAKQIAKACENLFTIEDWHNFGPDYDRTALAWFEKFDANWPQLQPKYGDKFYRMWKCYLQFNAGTFRARVNHLWQIVLSPAGSTRAYDSVR